MNTGSYERAALTAHLHAYAKTLPRAVLLDRQDVATTDGLTLRGSTYRQPDGRVEVYVGVRRGERSVEAWHWSKATRVAVERWARELAEVHGDVAAVWESSASIVVTVRKQPKEAT
jgi:hypothetical protein